MKVLKYLGLGILSLVLVTVVYNWFFFVHLHGQAESIEFQSYDGATIRGSLFLPTSTPGPYPAIVLLHGSGPASGTPIFVTGHANAFLKHGIAVLTYDKRGSGQSEGDFDTATYADFIEDALASIDALRDNVNILPNKIAVLGSSESGWFTPEIAQRAGNLAFIINRAGPTEPWIDTNLWEIRNELAAAGLTDQSEMAEFLGLRGDIWQYYLDAAAAHDPLPAVRAPLENRVSKVDPRWLEATGMRVASYEQEKFERYAIDISYDPSPYLDQLQLPVFAVYAGADQNVPTAQCLDTIDRLVAGGAEIQTVVYPGYTHGMFKFRNLFWMGYPPSYLDNIGEWAAEQFGEMTD